MTGCTGAVLFLSFEGMGRIVQCFTHLAIGRKLLAGVLLFMVAIPFATAKNKQADSLLQALLAIKDREVRMQALFDTCTRKYGDAPRQAKLFADAFSKENQLRPVDSNSAKASYLQGDVALVAGSYNESLKHCLQALSLAEQEKMYWLQIEVLSDISGVYLRTNDAAKSLKTIQQALNIARAHHYRVQEAKLMNFLAIRYIVNDQHARALEVFDSALMMARQLQLPKLEENVLENKAIAYRMAGQYEQALATMKQALPLADRLGIQNMKAGLLYQLACVYVDMRRLPESRETIMQAIALSGEVDDPAFILALYELHAEIDARQGNYQSAYEYGLKHAALKDSVFTERKAAQIEELQTRYDTELKDKQLAAQGAQISFNKKLNLFLWLSSGLLLIIGLLIYLNQRKTRKLYTRIFRQSEELKSKSRELEHLNQVKDRLFSSISHDMRAPVNSLLSFTMLLDHGSIPAEKLSAYAAELKSSLGFTAGLMENLLSFARSQMKGYSPKIEQIDLAAVTADALSLASLAALQKNITFDNRVAPGATVMADVNMLALILRNLTGNAVKFTRNDGHVVLSVQEGEQGMLCWEITDNGIGIEADLVAAFNKEESPHHQPLEHTPGTNHEKGTGLGLLLSKTFIALMNGHISLRSEPGKGSTFRICLPAAR